MSSVRREKVAICTPGTYKYFLPEEEDPLEVWVRLEQEMGPIRTTQFAMEIETQGLMIRSTHSGNPILCIPKRKCTPADLERFHALIRFPAEESQSP